MTVQDEATTEKKSKSRRKGEEIGLSIGAVARETGISIEALRMWERRYGYPRSIRLPSGHRRYPPSEVQRLRTVARALESGYRAGEVAGATMEELHDMLSAIRNVDAPGAESIIHRPDSDAATRRWLDASRALDDEILTNEFYRDWAELGPLRFLRERVVQFLEALGNAWVAGEVSVAQEHFASERLTDFLAGMWRRMNERVTGKPYLLATLPGDFHRLGLHMVAVTLAAAEVKIVYIGPQTPPRELVTTCERVRPAALCLSISGTMDPRFVARTVEDLRSKVTNEIPIVVGGKGAPMPHPGVLRITDFEEFYDWIRSRRDLS